jgi:hypothetical protein
MSNPFTRKETQVKSELKKKIDDFRPERRLELISQQAKLRDNKLEATKRTKTAILERRKSAAERSLQYKFQKFELRMNKPVRPMQEIRAVCKGWTALSCVFGTLALLGCSLQRYKVSSSQSSKRRTEQSLSCLFCVSRVVGRLMRIKKFLEAKRAFIVFRRLRIPLRKKLERLRLKKARFVANHLEAFVSSSVIAQLMFKWRSNIILIQRCLRSASNRRKLQVATSLKDWNRLEALGRTAPKTDFLALPDNVKALFLKEFFRARLRSYLKKKQTVHESIAKVKFEHSSSLESINPALVDYSASAMLTLSNKLTEADYVQLTVLAEAKRLKWSELLVNIPKGFELFPRGVLQ